MAKQTKTTEVKLKQLEIKTIKVEIEGTSPLMVHKWSEKIKKQMLDKQLKKPTNKQKEAKDPHQDYLDTIYWINQKKNRSGFPAVGFKAAMVRAGKSLGYNMTDLKGWIFTMPDDPATGLVEIFGEHEMDEISADWSAVRTANAR